MRYLLLIVILASGCATNNKKLITSKGIVNNHGTLIFNWEPHYEYDNEVSQLYESPVIPPQWKLLWQGRTNTVSIQIDITQPQMFYNVANILLP